MIEFSLLGTTFCLMLLGAIDLGRYQITVQSLRSVASEAARIALTTADLASQSGCSAKPSDPNLLAKITAANPTPMLAASSLTLSSTCSEDANGVRTIALTVGYPFRFLSPILAGATRTLSETTKTNF